MFDTAEKPLRAQVNPETSRPQTTFFYEQPSGRIIVVEEKEASLIHHKFKQVGVSDGKVFAEAVREAKKIQKETGDLPKAQELLRKGEDDERESARGHFQRPRDFSRVDSRDNPLDFRTGMLIPPNPRT